MSDENDDAAASVRGIGRKCQTGDGCDQIADQRIQRSEERKMN